MSPPLLRILPAVSFLLVIALSRRSIAVLSLLRTAVAPPSLPSCFSRPAGASSDSGKLSSLIEIGELRSVYTLLHKSATFEGKIKMFLGEIYFSEPGKIFRIKKIGRQATLLRRDSEEGLPTAFPNIGVYATITRSVQLPCTNRPLETSSVNLAQGYLAHTKEQLPLGPL